MSRPPFDAQHPIRPFALSFDVVLDAPIPHDLDRARLAPLARFVLGSEGATGSWEVTLALLNDDRLRALHQEFMAIDEPTDVITFPLDVEAGLAGGDIAVSVERAADQGSDFGHSPAAEVEFLLVHGLLHLCGWDDATPADREKMLRRQTDLLAAFEASGPKFGEAPARYSGLQNS